MKTQRAFTLIELVIVIACLTCLIMLSVGHVKLSHHGHLRSELDMLYQVCLYAQRHAMMTGQVCVVEIDVENNCYRCNGQLHQLSKDVYFGLVPHIKGLPSSPQKKITKACTFRNNCITCSKGGIISAGTLYLIGGNRCLYALTASVAPYSYLRKYRYADKWHLIE